MQNNNRTMAAAGATLLALASACPPAQAFEDRALGLYLEGGQSLSGGDHADALSAGVMLPWAPRSSMREGPLSFYWDLFASQWRAPSSSRGEGRRSYSQIGAIATWRWRFGDGESPWFVEAGIGASVMDRLYHAPSRDFSTAFQFTEVLGAGYSFGTHGQHELSLRLQHFSNADIKKPNPGEDFVRLRYAYRF